MVDSRRLLLLSSISLVGCAQILGIDDFKDDGGGGSGTTTTSDTTSSSGGTGGSGASGATGGTGGNTGGVGGTGGSGGTGGQVMICTPDEEEECAYGGPVGTKDVGICVAAKRKCAPDGLSYGACAGEVLPSNEICVGGLDEDCNNMIDDGCACTPNAVEPCYSGPGGTGGVGICVIGTHTCMANGMGYGACNGEVTPAIEACTDTTDQDCDGREAANGGVDDTSGCLCVPNASRACYTGPNGTSGVGLCHGGNETCQATGTAYGACAGQVTPASEVCTGVGDENCDGFACSESFWANLVGESATLQYPYGVTHDPAGNVYAVGDFFGSVTVGGTTLISAGSTDIFVVKYSPTGAVLWAKRFGDGGEDHALDVAATANEVYVQSSAPVEFGGGLGTGMSIARLTAAAGTHSWTRSCSETVSAFVGDEYRQGGLTVDTTGAVIAVFPAAGGMACTGGASLLGINGNEYTGMVKYSTTGTHAWSKLTGGNASGGAKPYEVVADASNSVWVTGGFDGAIAFGGSTLTSAGGSDVFLVKFDSTGGHSFSARYGDASNQNAFSVGVSSTGGPIITGSLNGSTNFGGSNLTSAGATDVFVARFLSTGSHAASARWGGTGSEWGTSVGYQANGDIWVTGRGSNTLNFGGGALTLAFLARMSGTLTSHRWSRGYPANFINAGSASTVDGRIAVVGGLIGSGNFGGKVLNGGTSTDAFVLSVDP